MKVGIYAVINNVFKKDLELLYGHGSSVEIISINKNERKQIYYVSCKLYIGDINLFQEAGEMGLNYLFDQSVKWLGKHNEKFVLSISFDLT